MVNLTSSPPQTLPRKVRTHQLLQQQRQQVLQQQQQQQQAPADFLLNALASVKAPSKEDFEFDASLDEVINRFDEASSSNLHAEQHHQHHHQQQQHHHLNVTTHETTSFLSTSQTHLSVSQTLLHTTSSQPSSVSQTNLSREGSSSFLLLSSSKSRTESQQEVGVGNAGVGVGDAEYVAKSKLDFEGRTTPSRFEEEAAEKLLDDGVGVQKKKTTTTTTKTTKVTKSKTTLNVTRQRLADDDDDDDDCKEALLGEKREDPNLEENRDYDYGDLVEAYQDSLKTTSQPSPPPPPPPPIQLQPPTPATRSEGFNNQYIQDDLNNNNNNSSNKNYNRTQTVEELYANVDRNAAGKVLFDHHLSSRSRNNISESILKQISRHIDRIIDPAVDSIRSEIIIENEEIPNQIVLIGILNHGLFGREESESIIMGFLVEKNRNP